GASVPVRPPSAAVPPLLESRPLRLCVHGGQVDWLPPGQLFGPPPLVLETPAPLRSPTPPSFPLADHGEGRRIGWQFTRGLGAPLHQPLVYRVLRPSCDRRAVVEVPAP